MYLPDPIQEIKDKSIRGLRWISIAEVCTRILQFVSSVALARLLGTGVFGIFGACLIPFRLVTVLADLGFGVLIVQQREVKREYVESVLVVSVVVSTISGIAIFLSAHEIESYLGYSFLATPLRCISFLFVISGWNNVYRFLLIRNLNFMSLSLIELFSLFMNILISVLMAWRGFGIWSLIAGLYAENLSLAILFVAQEKRILRLKINWEMVRPNLASAFKILLARIGYSFNTNIDRLLIGKFLGENALGMYVIAYGLIDLPVQKISKNVSKVALPSMAKFQDSPKEVEKIYMAINYYLSIMILPVFVGGFIIAEEMILLFYGESWSGMVVPLRVLCFAGIFRSFLAIISTFWIALKRLDLDVKISFFQGIGIFLMVLLLLKYGIFGASLGVALGCGLSFAIALYKVLRDMDMKMKDYLMLMGRPIVSTGLMLLSWGGGLLVFKGQLSDLWFLILTVTICIMVFSASLFFMDRTLFPKVKKFAGLNS